MMQGGSGPVISQEAADFFQKVAEWGPPFTDDELQQIGNFLVAVNLGPEAIRYSPGSVALLGAARKLYTTVVELKRLMAEREAMEPDAT